MPTPFHALAVSAAIALLVGGCARETLREMGSLKDAAPEHVHRQSAEKTSARTEQAEGATQSAVAGADSEAEGESQIETGSVKRPENCQGAHVAYQATREYLKNFGPRPPDLPGEKGPCIPDAR